MRKPTNKLQAAVAGIFAVVAIGAAFFAGVAGTIALEYAPVAPVGQLALSPQSIEGKAAIVYDPQTGRILFAKEAQTVLPLASLTKLMTVQAALAALAPDTQVVITPADIKPEGDWGLRPGDQVALRDLVALALVASSNDAAAAAGNAMGSQPLSRMNLAAAAAGLFNSDFFNPTGLDQNENSAGGYGSAYDVAKLTIEFYKNYPEYFELTQFPQVSIVVGGRTLTAQATMAPLQDIPGFVGAKTGYTELAGGNLAAIVNLDIGYPVAAVVLGSSEEGRFRDMRTLINAVRLNQ